MPVSAGSRPTVLCPARKKMARSLLAGFQISYSSLWGARIFLSSTRVAPRFSQRTRRSLRCNLNLLRFRHRRTVLEVVLENLRRQSGIGGCALRFDGAHNLAAADYFGGRQARDFRRQHHADLKLGGRLQHPFPAEQESGAADILGGSFPPVLFSDQAIAQGKVYLEALRPQSR